MHFKTQSCHSVLTQGMLVSCALNSSRMVDVSDKVTFFFFGGGGGGVGGAGRFRGEASTPQIP